MNPSSHSLCRRHSVSVSGHDAFYVPTTRCMVAGTVHVHVTYRFAGADVSVNLAI